MELLYCKYQNGSFSKFVLLLYFHNNKVAIDTVGILDFYDHQLADNKSTTYKKTSGNPIEDEVQFLRSDSVWDTIAQESRGEEGIAKWRMSRHNPCPGSQYMSEVYIEVGHVVWAKGGTMRKLGSLRLSLSLIYSDCRLCRVQ